MKTLYLFAALICLFSCSTSSAIAQEKPTEQISQELMLLSSQVPPQVDNKQNFWLNITYKSSLSPEELRSQIKYINCTLTGGGAPDFSWKASATKKWKITNDTISVFPVWMDNRQTRVGHKIKASFDYGDLDRLKKTNIVISNPFTVTVK